MQRQPGGRARKAFDDFPLSPFFDMTPLAPLRPDRMMDMAERMMDSFVPWMMPRGMPQPRMPRVQDIERDVSRGLQQTIGK